MKGLSCTFASAKIVGNSNGSFEIPEHCDQATLWSDEEKKIFQKSLVEIDHITSYDEIRAEAQEKTRDQTEKHLETVLGDVTKSEGEKIPIEDCKGIQFSQKSENVDGSSSSSAKRKLKGGAPRWTEDEHKAFLKGLDKYGKGSWNSISSFLVKSKTQSQVASHAQKYFRRAANKTLMQNRRHSIHDIRLDNCSIVQSPTRPLGRTIAKEPRALHPLSQSPRLFTEISKPTTDAEAASGETTPSSEPPLSDNANSKRYKFDFDLNK